jgi:hypothetical protein
LILLGSIVPHLVRGEDAAMAIEPQLDSATLEDGSQSLRPLEVMTAKRVRVEKWILTVTEDKVTATAEGQSKPAWTIDGERGRKLHLWTHSGDRAYFVAYPAGDEDSDEGTGPQRIRVLSLNDGKWLGHLAEGTGNLAAVSASQGYVAVLRLNAQDDRQREELKSYEVTLFGQDHEKPLWTKTFPVSALRGRPGVYLWSPRRPNYASSTLQQLAWLGDRLLVCAEAVQPILCLSRESGTTIWQIERPWEFERGFTGPSVWRHHLGRFGRSSFDLDERPLKEERKVFDERFQCAIVGGPIVVPRRAADGGGSYSIFLAISKGPASHLGGYVSDCVLHEFDADGEPLAILKLPQMVRGGDFALHDGGFVWHGQNETFANFAITRLHGFDGDGPGGRDCLARMLWSKQIEADEPPGWLIAGKAADPVAFGRAFAYCQPLGGLIAAQDKAVYDFPLVAVELASGRQHPVVLRVPFKGKVSPPDSNFSQSQQGGKSVFHTLGPHLLGITGLQADGDRLEITLGMESWSKTLAFDLNKLATATVAVSPSEAERIQQWLARIGDVNARDENGNTPLMDAAHDCDGPQLRALLKAGADPKAASKFGWTPLMCAAAYGTAEVVDVLIAGGSDLNARDNNCGGQSVLMWAARSGKQSSEKVRALLKAGADPKLTSDGGYNALLSAVSHNDLVCVEVLLRAGLDPKHRAKNGSTAIMIARESRADESLIKVLREAGAEEK